MTFSDGTPGILQTGPSWYSGADLLFPGTTTAPLFSGNKATVDYVPSGSIVNPYLVFGGLSRNNPVTDNKVFIKKGSVIYNVLGGYAYSDSGNITTAFGNTVTISGAGNLLQNGSGSLILSGNNSYTGATSIASGSVLTVTGSLGGGNYAGNIANLGTLTFRQNANQTLYGAISGAGSLAKNGTGALTLSGNSNYRGATTINAGTLNLTGTLANSAVTVNNAAIFNLRGNAGKDVNVASGATLNAYQGGAIGGNLNAAGGLLNFYLPSGFAAGGTLLNVAGNANITGSTVNVGVLGSSSPLKTGDAVTLLSAFTLTGAPANNVTGGKLLFGSTLVYDFDLRTEGNALLATVRDGAVTPPAPPTPPVTPPTPPVTPVDPPVTPPPVGKVDARTKALSEGFLAGTAFLNRARPGSMNTTARPAQPCSCSRATIWQRPT
jgi:autotransporter-associated beta strand protein